MKLSDFRIGQLFRTPHKRFLCTDIGTRTVIAVEYDGRSLPEGPPYGEPELVFDEYDLPVCRPDET